MNILLKGYFDRNFGDDIMHCMVVEELSEHKIFVNCPLRENVMHLEKYNNVFINDRCDSFDVCLYVIGTGFMYRGKRAKIEKLFSILFGKKSRVRAGVINCSLESFDGRLEKMLAKHDIKEYSLITARDSNSIAFMKKNFPKKRAEYYPDMVFSNGLFDKEFEKSENVLGVAPVYRLYSAKNYDYMKKLAAMCDRYIEKTGGSVRIFAFDSGMENDVQAAIGIKNMMSKHQKAEIIIYNGNPGEFAGEIAGCSEFITSRFHGAVTAAGAGVKVAAVYDRDKLKNLCNELGIPAVSIDDMNENILDELIKTAKKVDASDMKKAAKGHLRAIKSFLTE